MNRYDLAREASRTRTRPAEEPIALLGLLTVTPAVPREEYAARLRTLVSAAVDIARTTDFDREDPAVDTLPDWFRTVCDGEPEVGSPEEVGRRAHQAARPNSTPWSTEEWIYCFDPGLRAWSWWDVTETADGKAAVWVDTRGEAHIPCEELWWAVHVAGAASVEALTLDDAERWRTSPSVAVGGR